MIDDVFHSLSSQCAIPSDYLKLAACLFVSYALSPLLPLLPSASARHLMNISISMFFLVSVMKLYNGTAQLIATSLIVYGIVKFRIGGKNMPWVAFIFEMAHMLFTYVPWLTQTPRAPAEQCAADHGRDLGDAHGAVHEPHRVRMGVLRRPNAPGRRVRRGAAERQHYRDAFAPCLFGILVRGATHPASISLVC